MNPSCPECGELLTLDTVGEVLWAYDPYPPPSMRSYLIEHGEDAPIWECMAYGCFWAPARFAPASPAS